MVFFCDRLFITNVPFPQAFCEGLVFFSARIRRECLHIPALGVEVESVVQGYAVHHEPQELTHAVLALGGVIARLQVSYARSVVVHTGHVIIALQWEKYTTHYTTVTPHITPLLQHTARLGASFPGCILAACNGGKVP